MRFGAYRLIRPLGKGGFAKVWEAESEANGRRVALKVLRAESGPALRGGLLFRLFGIAVVRADGVPAGRLRCAARSLVAWSPLLLLRRGARQGDRLPIARPGGGA